MTTVRPFDADGPLPDGLTVLEASAGTGKTYTIEGLVTRYVAEGTPLPRLLVVTFTRAATAELRDRVRSRLLRTAEHLDRAMSGATYGGPPDPVVRGLLDGPRAAVEERRRRISRALGDFDAATISTIHGFCQHVLGGLGLTGDADRSATLIEDEREILAAVVNDVFLRRFHGAAGDEPVLRRSQLADIARKVVANRDAHLVPPPPGDDAATLRVELAREIRDEVVRRKRTSGLLSFDDVLTRLADTLTDSRHGDAARRRLAQQYSAALIDEFQDTDPVQWRILTAVFGGDRPLVLIGDPKQAIYAFRGADVHTYLTAARRATDRATLEVNWRSDGPLLEAYNALFRGAQLGHPDIAYRPVRPAPDHDRARLVDAPVAEPLRLRYLPRHEGLPTRGKQRRLRNEPAREHVARDLADQVVGLLASGATLAPDEPGEPATPVRPPHLAVLVRANADAVRVQRHLRQANVPAVINGVGSVFATEAALDWLRLLEALERPASPGRVRRAALTCFVGWGGADVAAADDQAWDVVHRRLHRYAELLRDRSVASLVRAVTLEERLSERLLALQGGERLLTDVGHVGELLHAVGTTESLGPTALAGWLRQQMADADEYALPEERARRLESDADAVQVMTIHRSKGLEFPILLCPFAWGGPFVDKQVPVFHEDGRRRVDVRGPCGEDFDDHQAAADKEQRGEDLRLLYVALTRARHQAIVWWAPYTDSASLARLLFCRRGDGSVNTLGRPSSVFDDETTLAWLHRLAEQAPGRIAVEQVPPAPGSATWQGEPRPTAALHAARFDRVLDHRWRRTSYSAITRRHQEPRGPEPAVATTDDEDLAPATVTVAPGRPAGEPPGGATLRAQPSPFDGVPGGAHVGTLVHAVLEDLDFAATDPDAELWRGVEVGLRRHHVDVGDRSRFVRALRDVVETPWGPQAGEVALRGLAPADVVSELAFELPLAGGLSARDGDHVAIHGMAALLRRHLAAGDPLLGYADQLEELGRGDDALRGYLTGSIDAVVRLGDDAGPRFAVVDYKTNRLAAADEPLTLWHYRPAALTEAMHHSHYPLQALLYSVALHRYLRWRLPGYRPATHLGGVFYLFVRGMTGPRVPRVDGQPCGVFAWQPPPALVIDLSDLLDGRGPSP